MRKFDPFLVSLILAIAFATFFPCHGRVATNFGYLTDLCIAVMFFLQGARVEPRNIIDNARDWRLQGGTIVITFVLFPLMGIIFHHLCRPLLSEDMWRGILFLCCLPSTVQSSIALTSIAKGNVPASICAATLSNLIGIFVTPLLVAIVVHSGSVWSMQSLIDVATQLLLPFGLGQALHRKIGSWAAKNKALLAITDRGSIVLVVYTAFSSAVSEGLWHRVALWDLATTCAVDLMLLISALILSRIFGRSVGFNFESIISVMFCGSKKSLASGIPMANILFSPARVGTIVLPLMIYHQIQLFTCTVLARRFASRGNFVS